jgi:hypothetical protein
MSASKNAHHADAIDFKVTRVLERKPVRLLTGVGENSMKRRLAWPPLERMLSAATNCPMCCGRTIPQLATADESLTQARAMDLLLAALVARIFSKDAISSHRDTLRVKSLGGQFRVSLERLSDLARLSKSDLTICATQLRPLFPTSISISDSRACSESSKLSPRAKRVAACSTVSPNSGHVTETTIATCQHVSRNLSLSSFLIL